MIVRFNPYIIKETVLCSIKIVLFVFRFKCSNHQNISIGKCVLFIIDKRLFSYLIDEIKSINFKNLDDVQFRTFTTSLFVYKKVFKMRKCLNKKMEHNSSIFVRILSLAELWSTTSFFKTIFFTFFLSCITSYKTSFFKICSKFWSEFN